MCISIMVMICQCISVYFRISEWLLLFYPKLNHRHLHVQIALDHWIIPSTCTESFFFDLLLRMALIIFLRSTFFVLKVMIVGVHRRTGEKVPKTISNPWKEKSCWINIIDSIHEHGTGTLSPLVMACRMCQVYNWQDQFDKEYWWSLWRWYPFGTSLGSDTAWSCYTKTFHQKRPFLTGHEWCPWSQKYNSCHCLGLLCRKTWIKKWKDCTTRKCTWIVWIVEMKLMSMGHRVTTCSLPNIQLLEKSEFKRILCSWPMPMAAKRPLWTLWCLGDAVSRADTCTGMELLRSYLTTSTHSTHCSSPACSATTKGTCTSEPCR